MNKKYVVFVISFIFSFLCLMVYVHLESFKKTEYKKNYTRTFFLPSKVTSNEDPGDVKFCSETLNLYRPMLQERKEILKNFGASFLASFEQVKQKLFLEVIVKSVKKEGINIPVENFFSLYSRLLNVCLGLVNQYSSDNLSRISQNDMNKKFEEFIKIISDKKGMSSMAVSSLGRLESYIAQFQKIPVVQYFEFEKEVPPVQIKVDSRYKVKIIISFVLSILFAFAVMNVFSYFKDVEE